MIHLPQTDDLACRLLTFEQQLKSYEKLHATELAELWQVLNDCKHTLAGILSSNELVSSDESNNVEADPRGEAARAADRHP